MKVMRLVPFALVLASVALSSDAVAQERVLSVPPETFRGTERAEAPVEDDFRPPVAPQRIVTLPAPTAAEIRRAESQDALGPAAPRDEDASADPGRARIPRSSVFDELLHERATPNVHRIGFGREFAGLGAAEVPTIDGLAWQPQPDGGLALAFAVASGDAAALRASIRLEAVPVGLRVRVYAPDAPAATLVAVPAHQLSHGPDAVTLWTPTVTGESLAVELYLPPGTPPGKLGVSIPRVSHLAVRPLHASDIGRAVCEHTHAACATEQVSAAARTAVAKYLFTGNGGITLLCTGTLLNDADADTQVPYFLTASHCVRSQQQASSMEFYWFFERSECGSDEMSAERQTGGATVLARESANGYGTGVDQVLLRLNSDPPDGVGLAGWSAAPAASGDAGVGLHHPAGDLKKLVSGTVGEFHRWSSTATGGVTRPDRNGRHVRFFADVLPEGGSSGSGLWQRIEGYDYLVGTLTGGSGLCSDGASYYGRFDRFYRRVSRWLGDAEGVVDSGLSALGRLVLVDAATRAEVADLTGGDATVDLDAIAARSFDVVAELHPFLRQVGSVVLELSGVQAASHASDLAPHTLFGDAGGSGLVPGDHTVTAVLYAEPNGAGAELERLSFSFTVTGEAPEGLAVAGLAAAIGDGPRVRALADSARFTVYTGEQVELRARTSGGAAGSVAFAIEGRGIGADGTGTVSLRKTANDAPFGVAVELAAGTYGVVATPYPQDDAGGDAGDALTVSGVAVQAAASPVASFTLVDAAGGLPDPDLGEIADGATVDLTSTAGWASVRADLAAEATGVERVALELAGASAAARTEEAATPVSLFGDARHCPTAATCGDDYVPGAIMDGDYELTARAFVGDGPRAALPLAKVDFTVTGGATSPVDRFVLVNAVGPAPNADAQVLEDGATVDLSGSGGWTSIRAEIAAGRTDVASVRLALRGARDHDRTENAVPYALFGDSDGDYVAGVLRNGAYTLSAIAHTEAGGGGQPFPARSLGFTVTGGTDTPVAGFSLVDANCCGPPDRELQPIEQNAVLSLADYELLSLQSIRAWAPPQVQRMRMEIDGPVWWGFDLLRPFVLRGTYRILDGHARPFRMPNGTYTLTARPSTGSGAREPLTVSFTVTDSPWAQTLVTGFTLLDVSGDAGPVELAPIGNGGTLYLADASTGKFDVRADLSRTDGVRTVGTSWWPRASTVFRERPPYRAGINGPLPTGTYRVRAEPHRRLANGHWHRMAAQAAEFQVTDQYDVEFAMAADLPEVAEGAESTVTVSIANDRRFGRPQELTLAVSGDVVASDYALPATLELPAGAVTATATFAALQEGLAEDAETATVTVRLGDREVGSATLTIPANAADATVAADASLAGLSLANVDFGAFDSATTSYTATVRYDVPATTVSAQPAGPAATVAITPADADAGTAGHQVNLAVGVTRIAVAVTAADGQTTRTYAVTVTRRGEPELAVSANPVEIAEGAGSTVTVSTTNDERFALAKVFALSVTGLSASDYTLASTLELPAGAASASTQFAALADGLGEDAETATVTARLGGEEIGSASLTVAANDGDATLTSLALAGVDFGAFDPAVASYTVAVPHDLRATTVTAEPALPAAGVEITPADAAAATPGHQVALAVGSTPIAVTVTAGNTELTYAVTVTRAAAPTASVAAVAGSVTEGDEVAFEVSLSAAQSGPLTVAVSVVAEGVELAGSVPASATFAAGATTATLSAATLDDAVVSVNASVTATLSVGDGYALGTPASATVSVTEDDAGEFSLAAEPAALEEGGTATLTVAVTNGVTYADAQEIGLAVTGDVSASDYALPETLTLAAGSSSATATFEALADDADEATETATVTASLGGEAIGTATLTLSDPTPLTVHGVPQVGETLTAAFAGDGTESGTGARVAGAVGARAVGVRAGGAAAAAVGGRAARFAGGGAASEGFEWLRDGVPIPGATGAAHVLSAADAGASISVRAVRGGRTARSEATVPVWGAPGNPPVPESDDELLGTVMTLGSATTQPAAGSTNSVDLAGYARMASATAGALDADAFDIDGTRHRVKLFAVNHYGVFAIATEPPLPAGERLAAYWDGYRLDDFVVETSAAGLTLWQAYTPQPAAEYRRYFEDADGTARGASDGVRVAVSVRRERHDLAWGERLPARDVALADAPAATGLWSDGETLWLVPDSNGGAVHAYALATGERLASRDLALPAGRRWADLWSDGETLWAASNAGGLTAWGLDDGAREEARDVGADALSAAGSLRSTGVFAHGGTLWSLDISTGRAYAFAASDGARQADRDLDLRAPGSVGNVRPWGAWSDGAILLTSDYAWSDGWVRGYRLGAAGAATRAPELDIRTAPEHADPLGLWSDGDTLWVLDGADARVYAYSVAAVPAAPPAATLSVADAQADEGGGPLSFPVTLNRAAAGTVTVTYATADGTTTAGEDYAAASGTLTFAAGATLRTVAVTLLDDADDESDETLTLTLSNATGAALGDATATGTIVDDDEPPAPPEPVDPTPTPALSVADATAPEGGTASFAVTLDRAATAAVIVNYATADGTATSAEDYTAASGTLTFAAGDLSKTVAVATVDDTTAEFDETFALTLSGATGATLADAAATGTIADDDSPTAHLHGAPAEHGGEGQAFEARLDFSEEIADISYKWVKDTLATATNADVERAQRLVPNPPANLEWRITVNPASAAEVTLGLTPGLTVPDGRPLRVGEAVTVPGPAPGKASVRGAELTLVWPKARDGFGTASASDWAVTVNGTPKAVAAAEIAGRRAVLVLSAPVAAADAVTVGYVGSAMHPLADAAGTVRSAPWDGVAVGNATEVNPSGELVGD
ncbi:MAG: cadherin-like beta sandwich domain-containing protein, partial [bacterium]|nr:cadherin-like beta sandwich domain-containing protein [bacterium]